MHIKSTAGTVLALSLYSTTFTAHAAELPDPVIVTATRTVQLADESVAPVIVIDNKTLKENPGADIADILRMYTGIEISRNGGPGQTTTMFIRGADSNQTLVMIDGVKINPGTIGGAALQNIDLSMVDHIEVVKGPRSTLYGSEAIGGVINIITKRRSTEGSDYNIAQSAGSYGTYETRVSAYNKTSDAGAGVEASYARSDGFPTLASSSIDSGYNNLNLHVYGSKRVGDTNYDISHWQSSGNTQYLDFLAAPLDQDFENATTTVTAKTSMSANWLSTLKLSNITDKIDQNQSSDFTHTSRYAIDWQNDVQWNTQNLLSTGLYRSQQATSALIYGSGFDVDTYVNAVYVQNIRTTGLTTLVSGLRYTDNQTYGDQTTWNLEYGINLSKALRLTLASNSGFRAPDSTDLYGYGGNPNLQAETSQNAEVGLRYQFSASQRMTLNVFRNKITNLIEYNTTTSMVENIGQATITGSELVYDFAREHWSVRASAQVQDPHDDSNDSQLLRRTEHAYSGIVKYHGANYSLGVQAYYSGTRPDLDFNTGTPVVLAAYTLVNLTAEYRLSPNLSANLRIENLGNTYYQLADGYNTPDRSAYAELRYAFK
jgi:vitamin B12 transporter